MYFYGDYREEGRNWWQKIKKRDMVAVHKYFNMDYACENFNEGSKEIKWFEENTNKEGYLELHIIFEVCDSCWGRGKYVNPNVDGHGISGYEFYNEWSEEDRENYFNGMYDIECRTCKGQNVIPKVDERYVPKWVLKILENHEHEEAYYRYVCRMERKMGC